MINTNELRRLTQAATPGPWHATKSVETNSWAVWSDTTRLMELRPTKTVDMYRVSNTAAFIAAANPAAISELLDHLEAAEKAVTEAYQRGYETGQEEIEKKRDALRVEVEELHSLIAAVKKRADAEFRLRVKKEEEYARLQVKIEQMERQKPMDSNYIELLDSAQKIVESYVYFRRDVAGTPLENDIAIWMVDFVLAQPAPSVPMDVIADYLVSISAHLARRDDAKAQAEIGELLKMLAAEPKPEAKP